MKFVGVIHSEALLLLSSQAIFLYMIRITVINRDQPDAVLIGLQSGKILSEPGARIALATALFRNGGLSLVRSAELAQLPLATFISHVSRLGIAAVDLEPAEVLQDIETLDQWLASS